MSSAFMEERTPAPTFAAIMNHSESKQDSAPHHIDKDLYETVQKLINKLLQEAWAYQNSMLSHDNDICISVLVQFNGQREVYVSPPREEWPFNVEVRPLFT